MPASGRLDAHRDHNPSTSPSLFLWPPACLQHRALESAARYGPARHRPTWIAASPRCGSERRRRRRPTPERRHVDTACLRASFAVVNSLTVCYHPPHCAGSGAAATHAWLAARQPLGHAQTEEQTYRQPAAGTMGILFKQASCSGRCSLFEALGQRLQRRTYTFQALACCAHTDRCLHRAAVPIGRQDLHVQPVQDALHRPRPTDQQGGAQGRQQREVQQVANFDRDLGARCRSSAADSGN